MLVLDLGSNLDSTFFPFFPFLKFNLLLLKTIIQVSLHNSTTHHLYILCVHDPKSLSITIYALISFSTSPPQSSPWQSPHCCPCLCIFLSLSQFLHCHLLLHTPGSALLTSKLLNLSMLSFLILEWG